MGKKRRLNSAKMKFNAKHANHPRMQHLSRQEEAAERVVVAASPEPEVVVVAASPEPEVVVVAASPEPEVVVVAAAPKPEVVLQEEKVEEAPKAAPKRKRTKKAPAKRRRAKKTVTQDVTT
jgi:hypothetical protein